MKLLISLSSLDVPTKVKTFKLQLDSQITYAESKALIASIGKKLLDIKKDTNGLVLVFEN